MKESKETFGKLDNGEVVSLYTLENDNGMKVVLSDLGATVINIYVKDKDDKVVDVALGHLSFDQYKTNAGRYGSTVGRNTNRIEDAKITINNKTYELEKNEGNNNLHGGSNSLSSKLFETKQKADNEISFYTRLKHLEDDFPGNLDVEVIYKLTDDNQLSITSKAKPDQDTIVNMTNHSYFNLNGQDGSDILDNTLEIDSSFYNPNTSQALPTGEILKVDNTAFDFRQAKTLKEALTSDHPQILKLKGLDHNFLLNNTGFRKVASLYSPKSEITMEILTDLNSMNIYSCHHYPEEGAKNKNNVVYPKYGGIVFETQLVPNSLKMPWLKSPIVLANELYETTTAFKFITK